MGALKQEQTVNEMDIITNVLFENGFVCLSDNKVFILELSSGQQVKVSFTFTKTIRGFLHLFGQASFKLENSPEIKQVSAKIASRLLQKYNEISE